MAEGEGTKRGEGVGEGTGGEGNVADRGARQRIEDLWERWLAEGNRRGGEPRLGRREERELVDAVNADPALREELQRDQRLHDHLHSLGRTAIDGESFARELVERIAAERDGDAFVSSFKRRVFTDGVSVPEARSRRRLLALWLLVPTTAALALFAGMRLERGRDQGGRAGGAAESERRGGGLARESKRAPAAWQPGGADGTSSGAAGAGAAATAAAAPGSARPAAARIDSVSGAVLAVEESTRLPGKRGDWLPSGAAFVTRERGARAALTFRDQTRLELEGDTVLTQLFDATVVDPGGAKGALVARGRVDVTAPAGAAAGPPLVLTTPHAEVSTVAAGRFALSVDERASRVDVDEGRVELARADGSGLVTVGSAQYGVVGEGREPLVRPRPRGVALLVVGRVSLRPTDEQVRKRLETAGFEVRVQSSAPPRDEDLRRASLILISSTVLALDINTTYRDTPVSIVTWEPYMFDHLGMTGTVDRVDQGYARSTGEVVIDTPNHPLAGGLTANAQLFNFARGEETPVYQRRMSFGIPGPHAVRIASWPGQPTRVVLFAYERGVPMPGLPSAPGKRVGLFFHDYSAPVMSDAAWTLFDAAVSWAVKP